MHKCRFPITTAEEMHGELKEKLCKMPKTESSPAIWLDHQMTLDERGLISVLALAAKLGVLDQIPGGATAEQLEPLSRRAKALHGRPHQPLTLRCNSWAPGPGYWRGDVATVGEC